MSKKAIVLLDESSMTAGVVQNIIEMTSDSAVGFVLPLDKLLWDCGAYPVAIGDRWEDGVWSRDGLPVTPVVPTDEINALAIAELSMMAAEQKTESDQAMAELSILIAEMTGGVVNV